MVKERYSLVRKVLIGVPVVGEGLERAFQKVEAYGCALRTNGFGQVSSSDFGTCLRFHPDCKYLGSGCDNESIAKAQRRVRDLDYSLSCD